jgi:hypothetical protein
MSRDMCVCVSEPFLELKLMYLCAFTKEMLLFCETLSMCYHTRTRARTNSLRMKYKMLVHVNIGLHMRVCDVPVSVCAR